MLTPSRICFSVVCTNPLKPVKLRSKSVTPATIKNRAPAGRCRPPGWRSECWLESSAQALKNNANNIGIDIPFRADQRTTSGLDVNCPLYRARITAVLMLLLIRNGHGQQPHTAASLND